MQKGLNTIKNYKFDSEYSSNDSLEVAFLKECGIRYNFVKVVDGETRWKYKKTAQLGEALAKYWKRK